MEKHQPLDALLVWHNHPLHNHFMWLAPASLGERKRGQEVVQPLLAPPLLNYPKNRILLKQ